jgi:hypothetical protein
LGSIRAGVFAHQTFEVFAVIRDDGTALSLGQFNDVGIVETPAASARRSRRSRTSLAQRAEKVRVARTICLTT